ncbi:MAG: energy-coupling factor transporter transmembrane component T family protein [Actinomycetota bacterium]
MHPGAWLVWVAGAGLVGVTTTNPFYLVPLGTAAYIVHAMHHRSGPHARAFKIFVLFGLITIFTRTALVLFDTVTRETTAAAFLEGLRLAVLLAIFGTFNSVSDPFRVLRLSPRRFHEPALAAALALSIAPRTIDAVTRVREAQKLRGMDSSRWRSWPALAVPVLETGMEEADVLAASMDARGHGRGPRTRYRPDRWTWPAAVTVTAAVSGAVLFVASAMAGEGGLLVSTFPLRWPEATGVLVLGAFSFALPALLPLDREPE